MSKNPDIIDITEQTTDLAASPEVETLPDEPDEPDEPDMLVKFKKPYRFEGKDYTVVDLAGLDNLSTKDMIEAEKHLVRAGMFTPLPEMNIDYVCTMAAKASQLPVEFFMGLPPREMVKIKNRVTNFFYGED